MKVPTAKKKNKKAEKGKQNENKVRGEQFVYVVNGKNRTLDRPKCKNVRHLFITKTRVDIQDLLEGEPVSSNLKLASLIKGFMETCKSAKGGVNE